MVALRALCGVALVASASSGGLFKPFSRGPNRARARGPLNPAFHGAAHADPSAMMPGQLGPGIYFEADWRPPFDELDAKPNTTVPLKSGLEYLRQMLQMAIQVEHSTIPLYLSSLYSIKDSGSWPATLIRSVAIEEMLHMTVAANILNAIGGHPAIDRPGFVPEVRTSSCPALRLLFSCCRHNPATHRQSDARSSVLPRLIPPWPTSAQVAGCALVPLLAP